MSKMTKVAVGVVLLAGLALVVVMATRGREEGGQEATDESAVTAPNVAAAPEGTPEPAPEPTPGDRLPRKLRSVEARDRLVRDIAAARERRLARQPTPPPEPTGSGGPAEFDRDYIKDRMQDLIPMVKECYEMALETKPDLGGTIVVDFNIVGEPDVGGLVETAEVDDEESTLLDPQVIECVRETVYALEIEPPPGGGSVRVRYPLTFSSM